MSNESKYEVWSTHEDEDIIIDAFEHRESAEQFIEAEKEAWEEDGKPIPHMWITEAK
jgi:hypothetical protein